MGAEAGGRRDDDVNWRGRVECVVGDLPDSPCEPCDHQGMMFINTIFRVDFGM